MGKTVVRHKKYYKEMLAKVEDLSEAIQEDMTKHLYAEVRFQLQKQIYDTPQSPNYVRTHNLFNSARYEFVGGKGWVRVGGGPQNVKYARLVHEGTEHMPPRPFFKDAVQAVKKSGLPVDRIRRSSRLVK